MSLMRCSQAAELVEQMWSTTARLGQAEPVFLCMGYDMYALGACTLHAGRLCVVYNKPACLLPWGWCFLYVVWHARDYMYGGGGGGQCAGGAAAVYIRMQRARLDRGSVVWAAEAGM